MVAQGRKVTRASDRWDRENHFELGGLEVRAAADRQMQLCRGENFSTIEN